MRIFLFIILFSIISKIDAKSIIEERIDSILSKMSISEKVGQLNQLDGRGNIEELKKMILNGKVGSVMNVTDPNVVNELQHIACSSSRTNIPLIFTRDVVHGFKTIFPIPLGQAATFDCNLVEECARIASIEATEHGVRWAFAPMIDISRDPRWGRIAESFGEDTYLTSKMGEAVVKGFQGDNLKSPTSMAACAKHFVGYGAVEGGRDYNVTNISDRTLRNVYLPPFERTVKIGCASIMTSFNANDGIPSSGNKYLLRELLRSEWGFNGVVVSDWGAINELQVQGFAKDRKEAALKAIDAGLDMDMSSKSYIQNLESLISSGDIPESLLDESVRNILRLKFMLGLFEKPYTDTSKKTATYSVYHLQKAKKAVEESVVLLKNNNILPLTNESNKILVVGPLANAPHDQLGTWNMDGEPSKTRTPIMSMKELWKNKEVFFIEGLGYSRDKLIKNFDKIIDLVNNIDVIIIFLGEEAILSGEAHCLSDIKLQGAQEELLNKLSLLNKPIVSVVMAGRPLIIDNIVNKSDACLYAWHPGTMGGDAIADILSGHVNPSGKLPVTFPRSVGQIPIYYNCNKIGRPLTGKEFFLNEIPLNAKQSVLGHSSYYLDIKDNSPLFPFGFGLSYTTFDYSNIKINSNHFSNNDTIYVSIDVKNIGKYKGDEVVQLYVTDLYSSIVTPVRELKRFKRITLNPNEVENVKFELPVSELGFYGINNKKSVEKGDFILMVGRNSLDGLKVKFTLD